MEIQSILDKVCNELKCASGVVGVILGGSRARKTNRPDSDIDIGIYYDASRGFDTKEIGKIAAKLLTSTYISMSVATTVFEIFPHL